jgi:hypothetical protein
VLKKMFTPGSAGAYWYSVNALVVMGASVVLHLWSVMTNEKPIQLSLATPGGWAALIGAGLIVLIFSPLNVNPFIYFQF